MARSLPTDPPPTVPAEDDSDVPAFHCNRCGQEFEEADACPACGRLRLDLPCDEHPDRTAEGRCVFCGKALCGETPSGEDPYVCAEHRTIPLIGKWAQVYSTTSEFEAQLVRENLRAEGIEAQIYSQKDHMYPVDLGELSIVRLLVPVWEYGGAINTIRTHMDSEGEVTFACPACGEPYEPGHTHCGGCGAELTS